MTSSRVINSRIAAHASWAATSDRSARTAAARAALLKRFEDEVDPDRVLSEGERAARAEKARRAFYVRNGKKSAEARRARASKAKKSEKAPADSPSDSDLRQRVLSLAKQYTAYAEGAVAGGSLQTIYLDIASDLRTAAAPPRP